MSINSLINKFTIYDYTIFSLVILSLTSTIFYGFGVNALILVFITSITTVLLDLIVEYLKSKSLVFSKSALISGLFIGGLLTQNLQWYIYVIAGVIAILSKHLIKVNQKHVFNPANFGIVIVGLIFGIKATWWISSPLILVLIFGIFIVSRMRRLGLVVSFLVSYYLIYSVIELSKGVGFLEIYYVIINGGIIYFFSMYMLIEPRTNPATQKQRIIYGILVSILVIGQSFTQNNLSLALLMGNLFVPLINRLKV